MKTTQLEGSKNLEEKKRNFTDLQKELVEFKKFWKTQSVMLRHCPFSLNVYTILQSCKTNAITM